MAGDIPAVGANIRIENTARGAKSTITGDFIINRVPYGTHNLLISYIGYDSRKIEVSLDRDNANVDLGEIMLSEQRFLTGEIVVSANKRAQAVQEVPISMSVIDSRGILDRSITRLDNVLEYVPGVEINKDNVSIRGSSGFAFGVGSRSALLLDGFPMLAADNGDMKFDALPMFNIERIEIVKGSGSALYGTSAIGGVINVITAEPTAKAEVNFRSYAGLYTTPRYEQWEYTDSYHYLYGVNAGYAQKFDKFGLLVSGGYYYDESWRDWDDSKRWSLFSKLNYDFSDRSRLEITINSANEDKTDWVYWHSLDSATHAPDGINRDQRIDALKLSAMANYQQIIDDVHFFNIKTGIFNTRYETTLEESNPEYRQSEASSIYTELQFNSNFSQEFMLTYGAVSQINLVNSKTYGDQQQNIFAGYAQAELEYIPNTIITVGSRLDIEKADTLDAFYQVSPKLGLLYDLSDVVNLRFSAGAGFRAPSIAERYSTLAFQGFDVLPNLDLEPEKSWSAEIGMNFESEFFGQPVFWDIAVFDNELFDLIEPGFVESDEAVIKFENVVRARIIGAELNFKTYLFNTIGLETSLTAMEPQDLDRDKTLRYRSKYLWYNRLMVPFGFVEFQVDYRYKSRIEEIDNRIGLQVRGYDARVAVHIVDARLIFDLAEIGMNDFRLSLNAKNLLDYYYTEMVGNLGMTRQISMQIDAKF